MDNTIVFSVGSRVKTTGVCFYSHAGDNSGIEKNEIGTVMKIRSRYQGTPSAYHLFIVRYDSDNDYA